MSVPAIAHALSPPWEMGAHSAPTNLLLFDKSDQQKILVVSPMRLLPTHLLSVQFLHIFPQASVHFIQPLVVNDGC